VVSLAALLAVLVIDAAIVWLGVMLALLVAELVRSGHKPAISWPDSVNEPWSAVSGSLLAISPAVWPFSANAP